MGHRFEMSALLWFVLAGCAGSVKQGDSPCRARAREAYSRCLYPIYFPPYVPHPSIAEPVRGADAQSCRTSYLQTLDRCPSKGAGAEDPFLHEGPVPGLSATSSAAQGGTPGREGDREKGCCQAKEGPTDEETKQGTEK